MRMSTVGESDYAYTERRFAELSSEINQLSLQVQHIMSTPTTSTTSTPTSTTSTSTATPADLPPYNQKKIFFYSLSDREKLPSLPNTNKESVFAFITKLEREFRLRNYELGLPADSTEGWTHYALTRVCTPVENRVLSKWGGVFPDISWEAFRKWMIITFYPDRTVREICRDYETVTYDNYGDMAAFNNRFRELRLFLAFIGKESSEDVAIREYQEKITTNKKVTSALGPFMSVERTCERDPKLGLEEIMDYCENVHYS